ncbi:hypothetical protein TREMEDRAFT_70249 [Tremella mesenterica DSM 1558]|uniref:uncharacterized protein n=1 Tax=Tremella mesenterica (strain ATCC 24925 / CBS 8224 / DSM 1558 / NBRC 9311 / NRRL Y-6157 / RJB 2259-6 / UBC 559-6) TaxID=578456 RepID=UPI00032D1F1A|nr:uncharacterized protein TREMEDRAFT_70249 [Tremella mesenterica DSM 1558]EIW66407.1 hypothetical protein TREMEDRAFT_70249 [Tremella mesenterica DSM 1558]
MPSLGHVPEARPRPSNDPDVRASKTLAYILRHGAQKEQLHIRSDGFVRLCDVLARPKMREIDLDMVLRIVAENAKQRFELLWGYDPSPPIKKRPKPPKKSRPPPGISKIIPVRVDHERPLVSTSLDVGKGVNASNRVDASEVDNVGKDPQKTRITSDISEPTELPLIRLPPPQTKDNTEGKTEEDDGQTKGEWFIRATQGHSIHLETTALLTPVMDDEEGRRIVGEMVHGTKWELWEVIKDQGLKRMSRQHIHLAPALTDHRITPRPNSTLLIYLDLGEILAAGIPVYVSSNGVILTPGNEDGVIRKEMWRKAERVEKEERVVVWENGKEFFIVERTFSFFSTLTSSSWISCKGFNN